jgi:hypothetical protein
VRVLHACVRRYRDRTGGATAIALSVIEPHVERSRRDGQPRLARASERHRPTSCMRAPIAEISTRAVELR